MKKADGPWASRKTIEEVDELDTCEFDRKADHLTDRQKDFGRVACFMPDMVTP
jgi:hypothetical protein